MTAKSSSISNVKCQAGSKHLSILWDTVVHNGNIKGELTHTIIERIQTEVSEATIVTRGYRWMKCELVCVYVSKLLHNFTEAKL